MSSKAIMLPPVSLSDIRGTQATDKLKASSPAGKEKIEKSSREFEAVLMSHWLEQAEQSFATVPGSDQDEDADPGRDQFHSIAMQAVGTALSGSRGGLGIATMVAKHLEAAHPDSADPTKPLEIKPLHGRPISGIPLATPEGTK